MTAPTALIADDEAHLRDYLKEQLATHWPELIICAQASNGIQARKAIQKWQPDFAFLDIKMPALSGIEVARNNPLDTHIIFVTAYDQYAIEAFENAAVDYLLKPVSSERLQITIQRLQQKLTQTSQPDPASIAQILSQLSTASASQQTSQTRYLQWIKASKQNHIELIPVEEIDYFQSADKYTSVITKDTEWIIRTPLKELEKELNPNHFWRIHRSTIIRVAAIQSYHKTFSGRHLVKLTGHDKPLPVSRRHIDLFKAD